MTLVPDGASAKSLLPLLVHLTLFQFRPDFPRNYLDALVRELQAANFDPYLTSVGGSGLGILSPYNHASSLSGDEPITPPETPAENDLDGELGTSALREQFCNVATQELHQWADARGRWLFV